MKLGSEILWLSEKDVQELLSMKDALGAVSQAFELHGRNNVQMPSKIYLEFKPYDGDLRAMPAYLLPPVEAAGVKIVNSTPSNPDRGLPAVAGLMVLVDPKSGLPLAVMGAGVLTSIRTGAAGGIAAKALARHDASVVGLVGCGRQAKTQLEALLAYFKITQVLVWGKTLDESKAFCAANGALAPMRAVSTSQEACGADIIVTTTPSRQPVVKEAFVKPGAHINAIGADAPGKQELETSLLKKARVVVDEWGQASHAGEINVAVEHAGFARKDIAGQLGEILIGAKPGRTSPSDITIFDSTGLAIQDVSVARLIYDKAVKLNKGQVLQLHG
jgi:alanine dehydrogenase